MQISFVYADLLMHDNIDNRVCLYPSDIYSLFDVTLLNYAKLGPLLFVMVTFFTFFMNVC